MDDTHLFNLATEILSKRIGGNRHPILTAFPVADHDLPSVEVDIMHAQPEPFERPQSRVVEPTSPRRLCPGEKFEQPIDLGMRENHRQSTGYFRLGDIVKPGRISSEHFSISAFPISMEWR